MQQNIDGGNGGARGAMTPLKFKASPQDCNFCNRKSLQCSKVAPLLSVASSTSAAKLDVIQVIKERILPSTSGVAKNVLPKMIMIMKPSPPALTQVALMDKTRRGIMCKTQMTYKQLINCSKIQRSRLKFHESMHYLLKCW